MPKITQWESFVGRRLRLRDLHVFLEVAHTGSMAKASVQLGVSQPAVSEVIATLEHALRVRLFDRSSRGVELTVYGRALLARSRGAFDELKQGVIEIEALTDPAAGELRIGCPESIAASILPPIIQRFAEQYPRVALHVEQVVTPTLELQQLRDRNLDIVLVRIVTPLAEDVFASDFDVEILFEDHLVVAAGMHSRWATRRHVDLADLVDEPWILTQPNSWNTAVVADAFRARGLKMPNISLATYSVHLRTHLLATGPFITAFPRSVLQLNASRLSLKVLPVDLPVKPWPVAIVTLKNRTLTPVAHRFIEHVRAYTKAMAAASAPRKTPVRSARVSSKVDAGESSGNGTKHGMKAALKPRADGSA